MKTQREILEEAKLEFEEKLQNLLAYTRELTSRAEKHGSEKAHYEADLMKAKNDAQYYENKIESIEQLIKPTSATRLRLIAKQGGVPIIAATIAFLAGVYLGSMITPQSDRRE